MIPLAAYPRRSAPATGSIDTLSWRTRLDADLRRARRQNLLCLAVGILLNLLTFALLFLASLFAAGMAEIAPENAPRAALVISGSLCAVMLVIAIFTKPEGRAECARNVFDNLLDGPLPDDPPAAALTISVAGIIALYGSFALVEAAKRLHMQYRLAGADRDLMAHILAKVSDSPRGVRWDALMAPGYSTYLLRGPVAALVLYGWVRLVDHHTTLVYQSSAMRRMHHRHPLADVFEI